MRQLLAFLLLIACTACFKAYKKVDLKIKEAGPQKLVVVSFISPQDTSLLVYVSRTRSTTAATNLSSNVPDATVSISNGSQSVVLTKLALPPTAANGYWYGSDQNKTYYSYKLNGSFLIQAGNTYTLSVQTPYGESAFATCTVPNNLNTSLVVSKEVKNTGNFNSYETNLSCKWQDHTHELAYYTLAAFGFRTDSTFNLDTNWPNEPYYDTLVTTTATAYYPSYDDANNRVSRFVINENRSEFNYLLTSYYYPPYSYQNDQSYYWNGKTYPYLIQKQGSAGEKAYLSTTDVHYYRYHTTLESFNGDDYFSEPSKVYSNIENGYGVFAAKNSYVVQIK